MPSGFQKNVKDPSEVKINRKTREIALKQSDGNDQTTETIPEVIFIADTGGTKEEEEKPEQGQKRPNFYGQLWNGSNENQPKKKMRVERKDQDDDSMYRSPKPQFGYECSTKKQMFLKSRSYSMKACKKISKPVKQSPSLAKTQSCCRKIYYRKRRYCCPGKRRYKASKRCCPKKYNRNKINICNRNWARISIHPFINFLRIFRRKFCKGTSPSEIARKGKCEWQRMSCNSKKKYYEQAKRARIRGYRT